MPVVTNPRRECFAQAIAEGRTATEAMQAVGYSDARNSTRLTKNDDVRRRVAELQAGGAARAEVTVATLVQELDQAREMAVERGQASAAVAATMGKARVTGQLVERAEVGKPGDFSTMSDAELVASVVEILAANIDQSEELMERARELAAARAGKET
jgi:hypothetical protein